MSNLSLNLNKEVFFLKYWCIVQDTDLIWHFLFKM